MLQCVTSQLQTKSLAVANLQSKLPKFPCCDVLFPCSCLWPTFWLRGTT